MVLLRDDIYTKDIRKMTWREQEETIMTLRVKVASLEEEKGNIKSLLASIEFAYERIKSMHSQQQDIILALKDENLTLTNDLNYLSYKLKNLEELNKQQEEEPIFHTEPSPSNRNKSNSTQYFPQPSLTTFQDQNVDPNNQGQGQLQLKKGGLTRQYSGHSIASNSGSINLKNLELRRITDTSEPEPFEQIMLESMKQQPQYQPEKPPTLPLSLTKNKSKGQQVLAKPKMGDLLFENFLFIGPSLEEIHGTCPIGEGGINAAMAGNASPMSRPTDGMSQLSSNYGQSSGLSGAGGSDKLFFSQSILIELEKGKLDESQREVIAKHAFPFKVKCRKYFVKESKDFKPNVYTKLFTANKVKDVKQFVFTIEGEQECLPKGAPKPKYPPVLEGSNPNKRQYCIYFEWEDFFFSNKEKNTLYFCPSAFCFITYYPFFTFFREVFTIIISKIQNERIPQFHAHMNSSLNPYLKLDATWIINYFEKEVTTYSKKLFKLQLIKPEVQKMLIFSIEDDDNLDSSPSPHYSSSATESQAASLILKDSNEIGNGRIGMDHPEQEDLSSKVCFMVPSYHKLRLLETSLHSGSLLALELFTFDDFWFILTLVMLEQQIVFFSKSIFYVSSAMQTFSSLFKPFNQSMLIFHISEGRIPLLETPPPFIAGINQGSEYIMANRIITSDSVRVNFIDLDSRCFYLSQETVELFQKNAFMNYDKYLYDMRKAFSIITHSQYKFEQNFEFRDHKQSKQFNQILYRSPPLAITPALKAFQQIANINQYAKAFNPGMAKQSSASSSHLLGNRDTFSKTVKDQSRSALYFTALQDSSSEHAKRVLESQGKQYSAYVKDMKLKALEEIHEYLEKTFEYYITSNLPHETTVEVHSKQFQLSDYIDRILKKSEEKQFTSLFLKTQNFQYFFQQYYEQLWNANKPRTANTQPTSTLPNTAQSSNIQRN